MQFLGGSWKNGCEARFMLNFDFAMLKVTLILHIDVKVKWKVINLNLLVWLLNLKMKFQNYLGMRARITCH